MLPVRERVVQDGKVITGAGVASGIDFALTVTPRLAGDDVAKSRQLTLEYAPEPPFDAGGPDQPDADPALVARTVAAMTDRWGPAVTLAAGKLENSAQCEP